MNSRIIGSCGHEITDGSCEIISIMDFAINHDEERFVSAVAYMSPCKECIEWYHRKGLVLKTDEERHAWLREEIKYPNNYD